MIGWRRVGACMHTSLSLLPFLSSPRRVVQLHSNRAIGAGNILSLLLLRKWYCSCMDDLQATVTTTNTTDKQRCIRIHPLSSCLSVVSIDRERHSSLFRKRNDGYRTGIALQSVSRKIERIKGLTIPNADLLKTTPFPLLYRHQYAQSTVFFPCCSCCVPQLDESL